jgi:ferrous iron transport protein B
MNQEEIPRLKDEALARLRAIYGEDAETLFAGRRYGFISDVLSKVLERPKEEKVTWTERIDGVVLNRFLGIPIFLALMWVIFQFVTPAMGGASIFTIAGYFMDWLDEGFGWLGEQVGFGGWGGALLTDGIIGGVGSVIIFVPSIFILFFFISLLEDSGYMARAAFVMDRALRRVGLHGRSAVPMLLGFGCNIPAIMATRTIENQRDRMTTILVNPFMSCGARLPIYLMLVPTFFAAYQGTVIFGLYIIGVLVAVGMAWILRSTLFQGPPAPFVMELPPYRLPRLTEALIHMWERGKWFLVRAGSLIFAVVILIWVLDYTGALEPIGRTIDILFSPCGFGQWQPAVGLITAVLAKEAVVGTFGAIFAGGEGIGDLGLIINFELGWSSLSAFSFMLFTLLMVPCVASLGVIQRETNSWKWMFFALGLTLGVAWVISTAVFQIGSLFT